MKEIEQWQRLMLTIPDGRFFDIIRNYLGKVKTPFHKPELIQRLSAFLLKEETWNRIFSLISEDDIRILTAILLLQNPEPKLLFSFLSEKEDAFSLHHHLINLEYRLLIITDHIESSTILRCNPLLESKIRTELFDIATLFPSTPAERPAQNLPWLQDGLVTAFLSFLSDNPDCFKTGGTLKKRTERELKNIFPFLFEVTPLGKKIDLLFTSLEASGIIKNEGEIVSVLWERFDGTMTLSRKSLLYTLWGNIFPAEIGNNQKKLGLFIQFIQSIPVTSIFTKSSLEQFAKALLVKDGQKPHSARLFVSACVSLGVLIALNEGYCRTERLYLPEASQAKDQLFIVQQNMHVTIKPEADFFTALLIARIAELRKYDIYSEYEITKASFNRFLHLGGSNSVSKEAYASLIDALPKTVRTLLKEWEKEYKTVRIDEGVVLSVEEPFRHLVDHNERVQKYIQRELAPGIYLFPRKTYPEWKVALAQAGIEHIPPLPEQEKALTENEKFRFFTPADIPQNVPFTFTERKTTSVKERDLSTLREELYANLENRELSEEQQKALKARIEKRFILYPEQLENDMGREHTPPEAKGIDFVGKVRLIEQALASGKDILEIIERTPSGGPNRYIIHPVKLVRTEENLLLVGKILPDETVIELQIKKLSLVRKLESILFTP